MCACEEISKASVKELRVSGELRRCPVHGVLGVSRRGPPSNAVRGALMRIQPLARVDSGRPKNNKKKIRSVNVQSSQQEHYGAALRISPPLCAGPLGLPEYSYAPNFVLKNTLSKLRCAFRAVI